MVKTLVVWTAVIVLVFAAAWYFIFKKYDYSISFRINETPGEVYQQLLYYNYNFLKDARYTDKSPFNQLVQTVRVKNEDIRLTWNFKALTDSSSKVTASVLNLGDNKLSRLKLLFKQEDLKEMVKEEIKQFQIALEEEAELYEIEVEGITTSPATTCACMRFENDVKNKASDMMKNIQHLSVYLQENELDMPARPRVKVLNWDVQKNRINFEFCFPIDPDNLPEENEKIYIKKIPSRKSLLAIYNGNYMYSHLAWVKLLNYAETENIPVLKEPLEVFNNNPEMGGDARLWEAEIYFPLESL